MAVTVLARPRGDAKPHSYEITITADLAHHLVAIVIRRPRGPSLRLLATVDAAADLSTQLAAEVELLRTMIKGRFVPEE